MSDTKKQQSLDAALLQIDKQFGKGSIRRLGDTTIEQIPSVSTGSLELDIALGIKGLPKGRIVEIFGPEQSSKTTLTLHVIREAQKNGGKAAFIDAEHALDPIYAGKIGVDVDNLLVSQPDTGEEALEILEALVRSNSLDVIVVDSVAALVPKAEIDGEMGDAHMGLQARLMSQAMRKLTGVVARSSTCVIFINQIRNKIGIVFGSNEVTSGGNALKFYSSVRLDVRKIEQLKDGDDINGIRVRVKVVKNKTAPPFRQAEYELMFIESDSDGYTDYGISYEGGLLDLGVKHSVITKAGTWYSYKEERLGQGRNNSKKFLKMHPDMSKEIRDGIDAIVFKDSVVNPNVSSFNAATLAPAQPEKTSLRRVKEGDVKKSKKEKDAEKFEEVSIAIEKPEVE